MQMHDGAFFGYASDVAYMTPAIEMAGDRRKFVQELLYEYRVDTGGNEIHMDQKQVEEKVYDSKAYQVLDGMQFADRPKTRRYVG